MRGKAFRFFLHVAFWVAIYLLPYLVTYGKISVTTTILDQPGGVVHAVSTALLIAYTYGNHYLFVPRFYLHRRYFLYVVLVVACVLAVIWLPQSLRRFEADGPLSIRPPGRPPHGGPPPSGVSRLDYNVILFLIFTFASISIRQQRQLLEVQKEKLNAELSFLKTQINPHFLFNTLNSIYALAIRKSDDAPKAIIQLSELMRYILKDSDADTVPLDKELAYINNYVALQKRRLGNTVQINYSAPEVPVGKQIAPLILMSFVENAFKHGVNPDQDSAIGISIALHNEELNLSVVNNKVSSVNRGETMGIGLKNAASRLVHLYPGKHKLSIDNGEKTFSVHLILQLDD